MKKMTRLMAMLLSLLVLFQSAALADGTTAVSSDAVTEELYQGWVETATTYAASGTSATLRYGSNGTSLQVRFVDESGNEITATTSGSNMIYQQYDRYFYISDIVANYTVDGEFSYAAIGGVNGTRVSNYLYYNNGTWRRDSNNSNTVNGVLYLVYTASGSSGGSGETSTATENTPDTVGEVVQQSSSTVRTMKTGYTYKIYDADGNLVTSGITITEVASGIRIAASSSAPVGSYTVEYGTTTDDVYTKVGEFPLTVDPLETLTGTYNLSQSDYRSTSHVYWDEAVEGSSSFSEYEDGKTGVERIESVVLNNIPVENDDSSSSSRSGEGKTLSQYYGSDITQNTSSSVETLTITPKTGYYVTKVIVACCDMNKSPYGCDTWSSGHAFTKSFTVGVGGSVSFEVPSYAFGHGSHDSNYFILIVTAPVPSPLYVEYDFGEIKTLLGSAYDSSEFTTPDKWTDESTSNAYGSYFTSTENTTNEQGVQTSDTQMRYQYKTGDETNVTAWVHKANTITDAAKQDAAEVGYYFAGWKAEYYTKVTAGTTRDSYGDLEWTFDTSYGTRYYDEGDDVDLITNVRLIAQWKPVELKVTKTVAGMTDTFVGTARSYTIQVEKQDSNGNWSLYNNAELTFTMSDNGTSAIQTVSPIVPGTYRVVETNNGGNLTSGSTVLYVSVNADGTAEYTNAGIVDGTTRTATLNVTNSYSEISYTTVDITKTVSGNMGDRSKAFDVTIHVKQGDTDYSGYAVNGVTTNNAAVSMTFKHNDTIKLTNVPIGATVTVTEDAAGYTAADTVTGGEDSAAEENIAAVTLAGATTIAFENNKSETVDTGILLDSLPYVLILVLVGGGVVLWLANRRRRRED